MQIITDLQLHSRFSRAVSPQMTLSNIAMWARRKGIGLVATGDWTHPMWFREIETNLEELGNGLLKLKNGDLTPLFLLATEVSCIYSQGGKGRRVHTLIWVPTIDSARKISQEMTKRGCNLMSDGRPIIGLTSIQVAELVFGIEPKALVIPAHAYTPWFSVYGSMSGFDSIEEAFGPYAKQIYAVETGLSSNPSMNWLIKELDNRSIVSFSDAHSGPKLGREATVFDLKELSYQSIYDAIKQDGPSKIAYTIEFYPEEGKYHWSGHRVCKIRWSPEESKKNGTSCPVCGKTLTQGVEQRVGELAGRSEESLKLIKKGMLVQSKAFPNRPPFVMLVPLLEIIAEAIGSPVTSPKVQTLYFRLTDEVASEFDTLMRTDFDVISKIAGNRVADGIKRVRSGMLHIDPGYDGVFGVVSLWEHDKLGIVDSGKEQLSLLTPINPD